MKLAFIINDLRKGGAERVVSMLSKELSLYHEVTIIVYDNKIEYNYGGRIIHLQCKSKQGVFNKILNIVKRTYKLRILFKHEKFDKIFAFMESAYIPAILSGFPIIASVRNNPIKYNPFITKYILPISKKVVSVSRNIESLLKEKYAIKDIMTINNPIDFEYIDNLKDEPILEEKNFIVAIGRLHHQKGFDILIKAFANSNFKDQVKLFIFGDGNLKQELQNLIDSLCLSNQIFLKGIVNNPYKYLSKAKLFVLSSRYEGFPNVLIEALACSTAVITTNCPTGPSEIINGKNGLLVENEAINNLTNAIDKLLENDELRTDFANYSRESIQHLNIKNISEQWLTL